jgi:FkbM family methyltransferase
MSETIEAPAFGAFAPSSALARVMRATRACGPGWGAMRRAFALRAVGQRLVGPGAVDAEALGARMRLYPGDNVCEKRLLYTPQYFDPAELAALAQRSRADLVFIDVGANVGAYALWMAQRVGRQARILAIEAQPELYERLVFNIRQNAAPSIKAIGCALADRDGEVTLFLDSRNRARASIRMMHADLGAQTLVPARSLARLVAEEGLERIDAMKLDAAGAEDIILEPFLRAAPAALWPGLLLIDAPAVAAADGLAALIAGKGYREILRSRANVMFERA